MSGGYDERLLASAPVATRAEKQEGYDINLFKEQQPIGREPTVSPPPLPVLSANHSSAEVAGYSPYAQPPALPWYRTRKWLFIFFFAAIVIIAAVIGGAVGGTVGHNKGGAVVTAGDTGGGAAEGAGSNSTNTMHHDHDGGQAQSSNSTASSSTANATGSGGGGS
ncbi:hypothetical protein GY45DRAFT_1318674 [Cubamyces sp. BRFM 1775]|nr:hypothetical protein GY45DRAFT_1318674 [Cubamyces sp. BRFM 1775]